MSPSITLTRLQRVNPPARSYCGLPLQVRLDSSALMKLEGTSNFDQLTRLLDPPPQQILEASHGLIEMRQIETAPEHIVVAVSALDLA